MRDTLETERLLLRPFTRDDTPEMFQILSDSETMSFWPQPFDLQATKGWMDRSIESFAKNGFGRFAVIRKSDGKFIGDCGFMRTEVNGHLENDLGYIFFKHYWRQGFATEAAQACLKHAIADLRLPRIVASMENRNLSSRRVAERIGMKLECEFLNSKNRDLPTLLYAYTTTGRS